MKNTLYAILVLLFCSYSLKAQEKDEIGTNGNYRDAEVVVGAIGGSVDVSGLGGATYTIPLQVPEGLGGLQPNLAIGYNNQGGNGLLGWCWDLQGISCISRLGTTLYHDGKMSGVDFVDDRFALDGQRLISISGSYGGNGTEYRTEVDGMSKIVSYTCDTTTGPAYFKVWLPNGNIAYYGYTEDSRIGFRQHNDVCMWLLNRVEDRNGNYMAYQYVKGNSCYWLNKIIYGGNDNANVNCSYSVRFYYSPRTDEEKTFIGNNTFDHNRILDSITIKRSSYELYKYIFHYFTPDFSNGYYYHRLNQIDFTCGNESYKPTLVEWGNNDYGNTTNGLTKDIRLADGTTPGFYGKVKFTGDFNGDGYTDVLRYFEDNSGNKKASYYLNKGVNEGQQIFQYIGTIILSDDIDWIYVADINGDGLDDLILSSRHRTFIGKDKLYIDSYLSTVNSQGVFSYHIVSKNFEEFRIKKKYKESILVGDFLGEGKQSFLVQECEDDKATPRLFYITYTGSILSSVQLPSTMVLDVDRMFACDFNGDGISEIYYSDDDTNITGLKRIRKNGSNYCYEQVNNGMLSPWHQLFPGDFNGDGKLDLLTYVEDGSGNGGWHIQYFRESELSWPAYNISNQTMGIGNPGNHGYSLKYLSEPTYEFVSVGDFNGDGKSDIAVRTANNKMKFLYAPLRWENGVAQFASIQNVNLSDMGLSGTTNQSICTGNFLGHENMSIFSGTTLYSLNPITNRYSVVTVTDGMGNCNKFQYDYLMPKLSGSSASDFYRRTRQTSEEMAQNMFTICLPMKGLRQVTSYNIYCPDRTASVQYGYQNALVHKRGRGLLGFKATSVESYLGGTRQQTVEQEFDRCVPYYTPYLGLKTTTIKNTGGNILSRTENNNLLLYKYRPSNLSVDSRIFVPVVTKQVSDHYNPDYAGEYLKKVIVENTYNDTLVFYGDLFNCYNILKQIDTKQGTDARSTVNCVDSCEFQSITHTDYIGETSGLINAWVINRPFRVREKAKRLGGYDDEKSLIVYNYQQGTGYNPFLPLDITYYPSGEENLSDPLATIDDFKYHWTGSVIAKYHRDLAHTLPLQSSAYEYSADGRFLTKKTNTAGYETNYEYDNNYGFLKKEIDCNGLITRYVTTPLGTTCSVFNPDGTVAQSGKSWIENNDTNAPSGASYYKWSINTGRGETRTYYDATGAKLRTITPGMAAELVFKDYLYNEKGLLARESLPYFGNDPNAQIYWTNYRYDNYNRLVVTNHPDGLDESNFYLGLTTQHVYWTDPDFPSVTTTTANVVGWTVESKDEDWNAVQYDYNADGSLRWAQIGNDSNTRVKVDYDNAGNRISLFDPNYGQTESRYNAYGQLVWTQTPKGNYTDYVYDNLGRMVKRYEHDMEASAMDSTVWSYSPRQGQLGLLDYVSFNGKQQCIFYTYDNLNRLSNVSEMRLDTYYFTNYTYDFASRVSSVTYPTGFQMNKEYTTTGHLSSLTDSNNRPLWRTLRKNAAGQIETYMTGDSLITKRSYEPETGRLLEILTLNGNDTIQENTYEYDKIANLAARTDHVHGMREDFTYDRLNRLTGIVEDNDTTARFDYDAYGRMLRKYMHSTLVFDSASYNAGNRPHAIAQAQTPEDLPLHRIRYTHFDKLACLMQDTLMVDYRYGFEHQRLHMTEASIYGDTLKEKEYVGNCEYIDNGHYTTTLTYLTGPLGVFGVQEQRDGYRPDRYFIHPDHLGSWTMVTDSYANIRQDAVYDAWGTPYCFTATGTEPATSLLFDRGFTGHEHLLYFGLINMNGRMYDPFTSGFLSVDNYVQSPDYTQSFNRYAYCLNNPLKYTDPDGEFWHIIIGAAIGGIANLATNWGKIDTFGEGLAYFGIGAAAGALGAVTGGAAAGAIKLGGFVSGALSGAVGGASSGMITGSGNAWMQGANFGQGLKAGAIAAGIGAGTGAVFGGLSRGIMDYRKGFDFWDGSKVINHEIGDVPINELYPNENFNLESYNQYSDAADARFRYRTKSIFGVEQGDMGIDLITTKTNNGYTIMADGTYATADGGGSLGYTYQTTAGYTEVHVSPYAAFHKSIAIFKATVGHELTHAYHYYIGLPVSQNGPSENAALSYSAKMYENYGMMNVYEATVKSAQSIPHSSLYNVPKNYVFSLKW
ncbi:MAG: hypothetical protein IKG95_00455 [Bacteroidales bacterium]|nr:hypothetical protein [Bacteroidales bacterium]